jgi:hypothetical protein
MVIAMEEKKKLQGRRRKPSSDTQTAAQEDSSSTDKLTEETATEDSSSTDKLTEETAQEVNIEELHRIVSERMARAKAAVVRDYIRQKELPESAAAELSDRLAQYKPQGSSPSAEDVQKEYDEWKSRAEEEKSRAEEENRLLKEAAQAAQAQCKKQRIENEARVQMAVLGVREDRFSDMLTLTAQSVANACEREDSEEGEGEVRAIIKEATLKYPEFLRSREQVSTGSAGNFPRGDYTASDLGTKLAQARSAGNNNAAASIIAQAAEKGIYLR